MMHNILSSLYSLSFSSFNSLGQCVVAGSGRKLLGLRFLQVVLGLLGRQGFRVGLMGLPRLGVLGFRGFQVLQGFLELLALLMVQQGLGGLVGQLLGVRR